MKFAKQKAHSLMVVLLIIAPASLLAAGHWCRCLIILFPTLFAYTVKVWCATIFFKGNILKSCLGGDSVHFEKRLIHAIVKNPPLGISCEGDFSENGGNSLPPPLLLALM